MNNIELSIFSNKISAICEEMGEVLRLSSFSPNIKDRMDFSCAIFDKDGNLCAQAAHIPVHLGSMAFAMKDVIETIDWFTGDMVVFNDPFKGGTHLPDVTIVAPVFINNEIIAYVANRAHHADIGSESAGSMPISKHINEEGILISPTKIIEQGELNEEFLQNLIKPMICHQTSRGDFMAQISANHIGLKRLLTLIQETGEKVFQSALDELNQYAQRICLNLIKDIPNGQYHACDFMEDDGFSQNLLKIQVFIKVSDHVIEVDFKGTANQSTGNINCPLSVAAAAVYYVFRCLMPDNTPASAGSFWPIKITAPKNSVINASYPAAVAAGNVETSSRIVDVILAALQKALPDRIPAASYGSMNNIAMGNNEQQDSSDTNNTGSNKKWSYYETIGGGFGASANGDGLSAKQAHMTNTLNTPIESFESHYPLRITEYSIRTDDQKLLEIEANKQNQGGKGLIRCYEFLDDTQVTLLTERRKIAPWGVNGAEDGLVGENLLDGKILPGKTSIKVKQGQKLCIKTPNGGNWRGI